jgi:hypothetical protein
MGNGRLCETMHLYRQAVAKIGLVTVLQVVTIIVMIMLRATDAVNNRQNTAVHDHPTRPLYFKLATPIATIC